MANADSTETKTQFKEHPLETLINKANQLAAMTIIITGDSYNSFDDWAKSTKHNYLWACAQHAEEVCKLAMEVQELNHHA